MKPATFLSFLSLLTLPAFGQLTERIETDRPDQTESPYTTPKRYLQAEFGLGLAKYAGDLQQIGHPTVLLKYGVSERLELRLEATPYTEQVEELLAKKRSTKLEPVEVGIKLRLFEEKGLRPKTSIISHVGLPFLASKEYHGSPLQYIARITLQNTLSEVVALGYNVGVERNIDGATSLFYTIAPGFSIGPRWYAYIEAFGTLTPGPANHNLDAGIAFNPTPNTKLDLSGGFGLGPSPLRHYVAVGYSFRLPL